MDSASFMEAVQPMQYPVEVHFAYVEGVAQDTLYSLVVDAQHLCDLFLRWYAAF
jgi:hypothetical protein